MFSNKFKEVSLDDPDELAFVVSEIIESFYNAGKEIKNTLFYYRDIDQKEENPLCIFNDCIYPIEIKTGLIIDSSGKIRPINDKAYSFPAYLLGI